MPQSIWSGHVRFGLVHIPVRLYGAIESKDVHFHQYREGTTERIRTKKVGAESGEPVDSTARGFPMETGEVVFITDDDLASVASEKSKVLEIEQFCDIDEIDPVYFEKAYWLGPAPGVEAEHPMELFRRTLEDEGLVGLGSFVMRSKEHLAVVRAAAGGLMLHTLYYEDEVRAASVAGFDPDGIVIDDREMEMARQLLSVMKGEWDPTLYRDEYRGRLLEMIQAKSTGVVLEPPEVAALGPGGDDIFSALEASVRALRNRADDGTALRAAAADPKRFRVTARVEPKDTGGAGGAGAELEGLTVAELRDLAKAREVSGRSKMTRDELIAALS